jgi:DNA-binding PadR family transcriptional regulator
VSPVFAHGRLRLYLLKLLEESPRHGYEVIRLLQDRFLGIYSPSPGTIYPRLARLEEEGLVTHEVLKGKKIYSITDKGRAELGKRLDELAVLEEEITATAQQFARGVTEDVRATVRSMREDLSSALRNGQSWREVKKSWSSAGNGLDDLLRGFCLDVKNAVGDTELTESELDKVKTDLEQAVERIRRLSGRE